MSASELLDLVGPFRGPCGICGGPDARHRLVDAVADLVRAGDSAEEVAADYGLPLSSVEQLAEHWWVWMVGESRGVKRVHRQGCRYGRDEYDWAFGKSPTRLVNELLEAGAHQWHRGCRYCAPDVDALLRGEQP